jgi:DNA-directed RNA polymerase subunit M/transcription elongation factor TFIIS
MEADFLEKLYDLGDPELLHIVAFQLADYTPEARDVLKSIQQQRGLSDVEVVEYRSCRLRCGSLETTCENCGSELLLKRKDLESGIFTCPSCGARQLPTYTADLFEESTNLTPTGELTTQGGLKEAADSAEERALQTGKSLPVESDIAIGVGAMALGGVITAFSYAAASPGGHYIITTGLFIWGGWKVIKGIRQSEINHSDSEPGETVCHKCGIELVLERKDLESGILTCPACGTQQLVVYRTNSYIRSPEFDESELPDEVAEAEEATPPIDTQKTEESLIAAGPGSDSGITCLQCGKELQNNEVFITEGEFCCEQCFGKLTGASPQQPLDNGANRS